MEMSVALLASILTASLVGSLHCAGMCGGFVAFYSGGLAGRRAVLPHLAYHGGRLATYLAAGATAGALGAAFDLGGAAAGVARPAAWAAGVLMIVWGAVSLARARGARVAGTLPLAGPLVRVVSRCYGAVSGRPPLVRAGLLGLFSTLLPCGWLYAFVVLAAGSGRPSGGLLIMGAFWAGTVPALLGFGVGVQALAAPLRGRIPALTSSLLLIVGLLWLVGRAVAPLPGPHPPGFSARAATAVDIPSDPGARCPYHGGD